MIRYSSFIPYLIRATCSLLLVFIVIDVPAHAGYRSKDFDQRNTINKTIPSTTQSHQREHVSDFVLQHQVSGSTKLIVKFHPGTSRQKRLEIHKQLDMSVHTQLRQLNEFDIVVSEANADVATIIKQYEQMASVAYVEPNMRVHILTPPNDPEFSRLWGLHNTGQTGGNSGADINAPEAWETVTQGDETLVLAVIDTGVAYDHEDLRANIWVNPGEIANNGIDDDGNGYIDDVHGIDAVNDDSDPYDDNGHGTHVAGTIAAVGDNELGVVGVNWRANIVACKFLGNNGSGMTIDAIECLDYLLDLKRNRQINLIATNNSWGGGDYSQALYEAIERHESSGILFVAAAGNSTNDNDQIPSYPSSYDLTNIISVAATDHRDVLADFSSYGRRTVDVAAPGVDIWSTVLNQGYDSYNGTSMATPHVTGLAGLIKAAGPTYNAQQIKSLILTSGTPLDHLHEHVLSGRRILTWAENGRGALSCQNQTLRARVSPTQNRVRLPVGESLALAYIDLNCAAFGHEATVFVSPGNTPINLQDNGQQVDQVVDDGLFSGIFTLTTPHTHTLTFPNQETLIVDPMELYTEAQPFPYAYEDIAGSRLEILDEEVRSIESPFPLHFAGVDVGSHLYVSANGAISFVDWAVSFQNQSLPSTSLPAFSILALWDDWWMGEADTGVYWEVIGSAPWRQLVVEWRNVQPYDWRSADSHVRFQVILTENSSDIVVNYQDTAVGNLTYDHGASATIGIQQAHDRAQQYSLNESGISDGMSLRWSSRHVHAPRIEEVLISGTRRITHTLTFQIDALAAPGKSIVRLEVDFNGDGAFDYSGPASTLSYAYDQVGVYPVKVRVEDSEGLFVEQVSLLEIEDLTVEEKIERAVLARESEIIANPSLLALYSQSQLEEALHARESQIIANPSLLGLYSQSQLDNARATGNTQFLIVPVCPKDKPNDQ